VPAALARPVRPHRTADGDLLLSPPPLTLPQVVTLLVLRLFFRLNSYARAPSMRLYSPCCGAHFVIRVFAGRVGDPKNAQYPFFGLSVPNRSQES